MGGGAGRERILKICIKMTVVIVATKKMRRMRTMIQYLVEYNTANCDCDNDIAEFTIVHHGCALYLYSTSSLL